MKDLHDKVITWAIQRNLIEGSDPKSQFIKLISEAGELADLEATHNDRIDAVGDMLVCTIILCKQLDINFINCVKIAKKEPLDETTDVSTILVVMLYNLGMMADAVNKSDKDDTEGLTSSLIYLLIVTSNSLGKSLEECLAAAYDQIKDRKGTMINGVFVKDES